MDTTTYPFPKNNLELFPPDTTLGEYSRRRPRQYWHDPSAVAGIPYDVVRVDDNGILFKVCTIDGGDALQPNVDGIPNFPVWTPAPSSSNTRYVKGVGAAIIEVDPAKLATPAEATALAAQIMHDIPGSVASWTEDDGYVYAIGETRRVITLTGNLPNGKRFGYNVGSDLLVKVYGTMGEGCPGTFIIGAAGELDWQPADLVDTYLPDPNVKFPVDPIPCPMRGLKDTEEVYPHDPMSGMWVRLKVVQPSTGGSGNVPSQAELDLLNTIEKDEEQIKKRLGIS